MTWIRLEDQVEVSTGDIIYELNICWDEYKENKEDPEYGEMVAQLHEVAAARLFNQKKCISFLTVGLIVTNLLWVLNTVGVI